MRICISTSPIHWFFRVYFCFEVKYCFQHHLCWNVIIRKQFFFKYLRQVVAIANYYSSRSWLQGTELNKKWNSWARSEWKMTRRCLLLCVPRRRSRACFIFILFTMLGTVWDYVFDIMKLQRRGSNFIWMYSKYKLRNWLELIMNSKLLYFSRIVKTTTY